MESSPRLLRPASPTLGLYLRPGRNDRQDLSQLVAEGDLAVTGLIFDPCLENRQHDLMEEARQRGIEVILDPRTVELSTVGGFSRRGVADLPWALDRPHLPEDLHHSEGRRLIEELADYAVKHSCSAVLAPSHYVGDLGDPWLTVDRSLTNLLREALNYRGANSTLIYYPLIISSALLRSAETRARLAEVVGPLPVDAIWLRVHPFGTTQSGPLALCRYIDTCRQLHKLPLSLVGERTGTVGLALLAFGAVGGIESGITVGERFDVRPYLRPREGNGFLRLPRVYLPDIGAFLEKNVAATFFDHRSMKSAFACQSECCRRGVTDMLENPRRHFVTRRSREVAELSRAPVNLRPGIYMDAFLRPATDLAVRAARAEPSLERHKRRLDSWRGTLGAQQQEDRLVRTTHSLVPEGRRIIRRRGA